MGIKLGRLDVRAPGSKAPGWKGCKDITLLNNLGVMRALWYSHGRVADGNSDY